MADEGASKDGKSKLARVIYRSGQRLFKEGDEADGAYLIEDGRVEITVQGTAGPVTVGIAQRGDIIGEMALFDNAPRSASARATEETTVMIVPRDDMTRRLQNADPVLRRIMMILVDRLRQQTRRHVRTTSVIR